MTELVEVDVEGILYRMTPEDAALVKAKLERTEYLDKRQYMLKIKMNSLYGALSNPHFRYFDVRLGNSTTGTGRFVLEHMAKTVGEYFDGKYQYPSPSAVYGDTDSAYFATGAKNAKDAIRIADEFAAHLNDTIVPFMEKMFLCKGKFSKQVKTAREVVADRGIFTKKKMYMLHVIDIKGKTSDKVKVMGLLLKKTLIPKQISKMILKVFERVLKSELEWHDFTRTVVELRDKVKSEKDYKLLGKPKTVKDMGAYEGKLDRYVRSDKVPGHVRAAAAYNKALRMFGDTENEPIGSGTKIRVYNLRTPEGFNKAIAIPTDIYPIPQWFVDHYWPIIDIDSQVEAIFDKPVEQVLASLNKRVPTWNDIVAQEDLIW